MTGYASSIAVNAPHTAQTGSSIISPILGSLTDLQLVTSQGTQGYINKFRNGTMDIWQRGASGTVSTSGGYTADGWIVTPTGAAAFWSNMAGRGPTFSSLQLNGQTSVTDIQMTQTIGGGLAAPLNGQTVTVQAQIYNGAENAITPTVETLCPAMITGGRRTARYDNWGGSPIIDLATTNLQSCAPFSWTNVATTFPVSSDAQYGYEVIFDFGNNFAAVTQATNTSTLTSSNVLNFGANNLPAILTASGFNFYSGQLLAVDITTKTAITGGQYITAIDASAGTVTLSGNVNGTVGSGDTILFLYNNNSLGHGTPSNKVSSSTSTSSAILNFSGGVPSGVAIGQMAFDYTTYGAIRGGQTVIAIGPTTVTLSNNVNATVNTNDVIAFGSQMRLVQVCEFDIRVTPGLPTGLNSAPPTPELRPIQAELALCQRYFYLFATFSLGVAANAYFVYGGSIVLPVPMRATPTLSSASFTASSGSVGTPALSTSSAYAVLIYNSAGNWSAGAGIAVSRISFSRTIGGLMAAYQLTSGTSIIRESDGAFIPDDPRNADYGLPGMACSRQHARPGSRSAAAANVFPGSGGIG